jgi:FkbM family methyltransferase
MVPKLLESLHRGGMNRSSAKGIVKAAGYVCWAAFLTLLVWSSPTVKGRRGRCVFRFWAWQCRRRLSPRAIHLMFPQGWTLELPTWSELAGITAATGMHEPAEQLFVFAYLRPGDIMIDVGANVGIYTIAAGFLGARVAAFEPSSGAQQVLRRNIVLNRLEESVRVFPMALGDTIGSMSFTTDLDVGNHLLADPTGSATEETVEVRSLDSVVNDEVEWFERATGTLLKVDVEGHDAEVLRGARRAIANYRPVVLVETWDGGTEVRAFLAELDYRVYRFDLASRTLVEYPRDWKGQANFIGVHDEALGAVKIRIGGGPIEFPAPPIIRWWGAND